MLAVTSASEKTKQDNPQYKKLRCRRWEYIDNKKHPIKQFKSVDTPITVGK
ncbi:hypothetical protein AAEU32_14655 [Pseudoalteromonas sp. SSDWG2]